MSVGTGLRSSHAGRHKGTQGPGLVVFLCVSVLGLCVCSIAVNRRERAFRDSDISSTHRDQQKCNFVCTQAGLSFTFISGQLQFRAGPACKSVDKACED